MKCVRLDAGEPFPFPPYLYHAAITIGRDASSEAKPAVPPMDRESDVAKHVPRQFYLEQKSVYDWRDDAGSNSGRLQWSGYYLAMLGHRCQNTSCTLSP
jgi:hypothetical protein